MVNIQVTWNDGYKENMKCADMKTAINWADNHYSEFRGITVSESEDNRNENQT